MSRALLAALLAFSAAAFAQSPMPAAPGQQTDTSQPTTTLKVTTRLVLVDAVIRDKAGNPITDLKQDEVQVLENGKPQKIRVMQLEKFEAKPGAQATAQPKLPPNIFSNMPAVVPTDAPPTVLLVDALNTTAITQAYARQKMVNYLKTVPPGQRMAIYLLGHKLMLLQDFTSDPAVLKTALDRVKPSKGALTQANEIQAPASDSDTLFGLRTANLSTDAAIAATQSDINDFLNGETEVKQDMRCMETMNALESIARHASGYAGRKNLVWMAGGFPLTITHIDAIPHEMACRQRMEHTATVLTDAQVAIYPIDSRGLMTDFDSGPVGGPPDVSGNAQLLTESHQAATQIAEDTGGRAFYNDNDLSKLVQRSVTDGSTYYLFGYYPEDKDWNGKFRKITVKVNRPGLEVRSRKGYFAENPVHVVDPKDKKSMDELGRAMQFDEAPWTQIPMDIQVVPGAETIVRFAVDGEELHWEPLPDGGRQGSFSFVVFAYDPKGKLIGQAQENAGAKLKRGDNRAHAALPYQQTLHAMPPGKYLLKAAVRDNNSGRIGTVTASLEVPAS